MIKLTVFSPTAGTGPHICCIDSAAARAGPAICRGVSAGWVGPTRISAGRICPVGIVAGGRIITAAFVAENGIAEGSSGGIHGGKGFPFAHDKSTNSDQIIDGSAHADQADQNAQNI